MVEKNTGISFSVSPDVREKINRLAEAEGRSVRSLMLWLVDQRIKENAAVQNRSNPDPARTAAIGE